MLRKGTTFSKRGVLRHHLASPRARPLTPSRLSGMMRALAWHNLSGGAAMRRHVRLGLLLIGLLALAALARGGLPAGAWNDR